MGKEDPLHTLPLREFYRRLDTSPKGLGPLEVQNRRKHYGKNRLPEKKKTHPALRFLSQFKNLFSMLLLIGALLSFISNFISHDNGALYIGYALLIVTIINAVFTFIQEYTAEKAMESFKDLLAKKIIVIRDNEEKEIDVEDLVPGDVIILKEGDKIPADARLIEENLLKVDHSSLTGEAEPQLRCLESTSRNKINSRNMVLSGTLVQSGDGKAVVTHTGQHTEIGKIAHMTHQIDEGTSHLQHELNYFISIISYLAVLFGVIFFAIGMFVGNSMWMSVVFAIGIIVANVPEGLLPTVTLTLSIAAKKMAKKNALVKNIEAIETLGAVTVICTDKTGTLTEDRMTVDSIFINNKLYHFNKNMKSLMLEEEQVRPSYVSGFGTLLHAVVHCNNAYINKESEHIGDPTEIALLEMSSVFKDINLQRHTHKRLYEIPFESSKKYMITANIYQDEISAYLKGAPEVVMSKCSKIRIEGKDYKISKEHMDVMFKHNDALSKKGNRILAVAKKNIPGGIKAEKKIRSSLEQDDYVLLGLISMFDPPRPEVPFAVQQCRNAGIKIIVISGDQALTVESIARQVGIITSKKPTIITGEDLKGISDERLKLMLRDEDVMLVRALPEDKLRVVSVLSDAGEIVAVTGDGVNDAPALKKAHVGVAMGKQGTEVAKEAADIILLDDNFATIVTAIKSGRTVYDNIKNFITYILASNIPELVPFLAFVVFGWPIALPVLLILAIDLGTDMLPAIALGYEKEETDVMKQKPRDKNDRLFTMSMLARSYSWVGPLEALYAFIIFFSILFNGGWKWGDYIMMTNPLYMSAVAGFFACVVVCQVFNVLSCRTRRQTIFGKRFFSNKFIFLGIAAELIFLLIILYAPIAQRIFGTAPFAFKYVPVMIIFGITILVQEEARKYVARRFGVLNVN